MKDTFNGSMVALITPMNADFSLDWDALHKLVEWHIQEGTSSIVAVGTTGESATLNLKDHIEVVKRVVKMVNGRVPVVAGTGANSTSEALEQTELAKQAGADACLLVTPYYNKPTQEGLFLHHEYVAKNVAIPQLLYNVPGRTAVDMLPETVERLSKIDNIVGIKDATGDIERIKATKALVGDDFALLSGDDGSAVSFMENGGHGEISVTANVAPKLVAEMCRAAAQGRFDEAYAIDKKLQPVHDAMFVESNPIPVKWAVSQMGYCEPAIRLPLTQLSQPFHSDVLNALKSAELI